MGWHDIKRDPADDAFSEWIRRRDKYCQKCGQPGYGLKGITGLDASHFIGRGKEATRFDPLNVDALCRNCHRWFGEHRTEHEAWQVEKKGQDVVDRLKIASTRYHKKDRVSEKLYWRQKLREDYPV